MNAIADDTNAPRIGDLSYKPGVGIDDVMISSLRSTMLLALANPEQVSQLFVDHVMLAVGMHVAQTYGGMRPVSPRVRRGLAPWQAHSTADTLITPMNDSLLDFDVLGSVDPTTYAVTGVAHYAAMVRQVRR